ncbi:MULTISPECIES: metallophosphoesterase family protein [Myroides]|uniref:metallophosphoesterase family protein n=1 Tax=Myroides odoratus TaxID=256 RepID=UPI000765AF24|nr:MULTISPECIES: metallophosphoesterase family protein [Myroides]WHT38199.1 metallophosphoesterase family protein [Myroides sp. mNGS23_01]
MKKILLLSDTHSCMDESILKYVKQADEVWHAGDIGNLQVTDEIKKYKPLRAVYGNIDDAEARLEFPEEQVFVCEGMKVYMIHIGGYPGKYRTQVKNQLLREKPGLYICGHSHILKIQYDPQYSVLHLNPGAAGISGFHQVRTMLRFVLDQGNIKDMELIEWPKNKKTEQF